MFSLFRRISYGAIPRADRPWEDDPTSNAPTRRKRRMSSVERDAGEDEEQSSKRARGDTPMTPSVAGKDDPLELKPQNDTEEVKEVTQGVHEVTLETEAAPEGAQAEAEVAPEAVPLPEDKPGELDETEPIDNAKEAPEAVDSTPSIEELSAPVAAATAEEDVSDVASSSGDVVSPAASPRKKTAPKDAKADEPSLDTDAVPEVPSAEEEDTKKDAE